MKIRIVLEVEVEKYEHASILADELVEHGVNMDYDVICEDIIIKE